MKYSLIKTEFLITKTVTEKLPPGRLSPNIFFPALGFGLVLGWGAIFQEAMFLVQQKQ